MHLDCRCLWMGPFTADIDYSLGSLAHLTHSASGHLRLGRRRGSRKVKRPGGRVGLAH